MKKNILILSSALLFGASVLMIGCKKDDTTAPVVTLTGSDVTLSLQGSYSELGATANDDEDGAVTVSTTGTVDVNKTGTYTITYTATDAAGNEGSATRTVTVKNDADYLTGTYTTTEGTDTWTQTVKASSTVNNRLEFSKFANYSNNVNVRALVTGNEVEIINTTVTGIGLDGCTHIFTSVVGGVSIAKVAGKYTFGIRFSDDQEAAGGAGCTDEIAVTYLDSFVQN